MDVHPSVGLLPHLLGESQGISVQTTSVERGFSMHTLIMKSRLRNRLCFDMIYIGRLSCFKMIYVGRLTR